MSVGAIVDRKEIPAFVRFERRAVEDKAATLKSATGTVQYVDVDYALVTPPYSKDVFQQRADKWLSQMKRDAENGRLPLKWYETYEETYKRWKRGEEMPLEGTPIKGWPVITPAQQSLLIGLNIQTVEVLAAVNDEGLRRIGMGAMELKNKARAWLSQAQDKGPLTMENAKLKADVEALQARNEQLEDRVRELANQVGAFARVQAAGAAASAAAMQEQGGISADDIIDPAPQKKRGRPKQQPDSTDAPI